MAETGSSSPAPVSAIVAMIRVTDVMRSAAFYGDLGFAIGNAEPRECPPYRWAWMFQPNAAHWKTGANLMISSGELPGTVESRAKTVLFYLYAHDMKGLREELLAKGVPASEISYPPYLPEGEFSVEDPDGYRLMIAQSGTNTP